MRGYMMRFIVNLIILMLFFGGGIFWGLMYNPTQLNKESPEIINNLTTNIDHEVEMQSIDEVSPDIIEAPNMTSHPVSKFATIFEKITTFFFDTVVLLLFSIAELLF